MFAMYFPRGSEIPEEVITEAEPIFFVAEQIFCSFFTVELVALRNRDSQ